MPQTYLKIYPRAEFPKQSRIHALAYNLGNFLWTLGMLEPIKDWSLTSLKEPRTLCRLPNGRGRHPTANVPGDSAAHRRTAAAATTSHGETLDGHAFNSNQPEECVPMPENGHIISSTNVRAAPRCC